MVGVLQFTQPAAFAMLRATPGVTVGWRGTMMAPGFSGWRNLSSLPPPTLVQPSRSFWNPVLCQLLAPDPAVNTPGSCYGRRLHLGPPARSQHGHITRQSAALVTSARLASHLRPPR